MQKKEFKIFTKNHQITKRDYLERMVNNKIECMIEAKKYGKNYWDGPRKYGYGGYKFIPGRWNNVANKIIKTFRLKNTSKILDVGCGKAFILYEIKKILPNIEICGFDISKYGIKKAPKEIKKNLFVHDARKKYPFKNKEFDFALSSGCFHNLKINELKYSLNEFQRVSKNSFVMVESFRNSKELFNLQCWALTCQSFFSKQEWEWIFKEFGYNQFYEFIYFS